MDIQGKLERAKVRLVLRYAFLATLLLSMRMESSEECPTLCTDGGTIWYNPAFIEAGSPDDVVFYLAHEVMHTAMLHSYRLGGRDPQRANIAMDHAINLILAAEGFSVDATRFHCNPKYTDMAWEEIYALLPEGSGGDSIGDDVRKAPDKAGAEAEMRARVAQAASIARAQGAMSANMDKLVKGMLRGEVNWRDELRQFMYSVVKSDQSWARPNRRHIARGVYLPSLHTAAIGEVAVIVDTSGSCWDKGAEFLSEIQSICEEVKPEVIRVLMVDTKVVDARTYEPGEPIHMGLKGGGGTNMSPGFRWLESHGITPAVCLVFTDMEMRWPEQPEYPVIWATYGKEILPPWGDVVRL